MYAGTLMQTNTINVYNTFMGMKYLPLKIIFSCEAEVLT